MASAHVDCVSSCKENVQTIELIGELTVSSAMEAWSDLVRCLATPSPRTLVDCGQISDCDTAGAQMLYALHALARTPGSGLTCTSVSPSIEAALARIGLSVGEAE